MEKCIFEKVDECIYKEVLDNGLEVYLYPNKKTKNFYITISVKYGSSVLKYKVNNEINEIIPGSAHFLEHKVMAISENKKFSKKIKEYGSIANAWTNSYGTNYNIFGSKNIYENIKLLLDIFYNTNINDKNVEEEKGIIGEEIDMYKDKINMYMTETLCKSIFKNAYPKNTTVGERSDIAKITANSLNKIYNDYYIPNNTFIIVCGDFDNKKCLDLIKKQIKKYNPIKKELPEKVIEKEPLKVNKDFIQIEKNVECERVKIGFKFNKDILGISDDNLIRYYLDIIFSCYISPTSKIFEKYKNEELFYDGGYGVTLVEDKIVIIVSAACINADRFIKEVLKDIKKLNINKEDFERKKKLYLKSYIMDFDNIEDIEYNICMSLMVDGYINYKEYSQIINLDYKEALRIIKLLKFDNYSIVKCIEKE